MRKPLFVLASLAALALAPPARAGHDELLPGNDSGFRLVPITGSSCAGVGPVLTGDVSGATGVCAVPYASQLINVGGQVSPSGRMRLVLSQTNHASGSIYDVWAVNNAGAVWLCAEGSLWSSTTARSGTPTFSLAAGVAYANPSQLSHCYNGSTDYGPIAANAATYLGSFYVPTATATTVSSQTSSATTLSLAAALTGPGLYEQYYVAVDTGANLEYELVTAGFGTTTLTVTRGQLGTSAVAHTSAAVAIAGGQTAVQFNPACVASGSSPLIGLWNAYNRVPIAVAECDASSSWTYTTSTFRAAHGSNANRITFVDGLQQSPLVAVYGDSVSGSAWGAVGVGFNSTSSLTGINGQAESANEISIQGFGNSPPLLGLNYVAAMEWASGSTPTFYGGATVMGLKLEMGM